LALAQESQEISPLVDVLTMSSAARWLADYRGPPLVIEDIVKAVFERVRADGIPIMRFGVNVSDYRPQFIGRSYFLEEGGGLEIVDRDYTPKRTETYHDSPIRVIQEGADGLRRRLDGPNAQLDFPIVRELKARGATDYVGVAVDFSDGSRHFASWTTNRAGGFKDSELNLLDALLPLLSVRLEVAHSRRATQQLLTTYLGTEATRRIMSGEFRRSLGEDIEAVIFYCDLRGFTRMTEMLQSGEIIAVLSEYFDAVAGAVRARQGDIIEMIGDGMIAIFRVTSDFTATQAANEALETAREAIAALAAIPAARLPNPVNELRAGFALNVGQVTFGNIGSKDRLDFTVIGPAVNEASRIEPLTKSLGYPVLMTDAFAKLCPGEAIRSLGFHVLRGVREPREIFTLAE
jgi:adenylate cyclase